MRWLIHYTRCFFSLCTEVKSLYAVPSSCRGIFPYTRGLSYYVRWLIHYTRCFFHYARKLSRYTRAIFLQGIFPLYSVLFYYVQWLIHYTRCFFHYIQGTSFSLDWINFHAICYRTRSSVGRVTVDLIRRSWVRFPPRSNDFFFTSCGSLIPITRANAQ